MGNSWQTDDHKRFFDEHLASYSRSFDKGQLKDFWPAIADEWFKQWPLGDIPPELVEKKGSVEKAEKALKAKKMEVSVTQ